MFSGRAFKIIDMSGFDTTLLVDMYDMFAQCYSLTTIYVSDTWDVSHLEDSSNGMFHDTYDLTGEKGTPYDYYHEDASYAHVDGGPSNPGYLTLKGHTKDFAVMVNGNIINDKLKSFNTENKDFRKATTAEYNTVKNTLTPDDIVSSSEINVYMWETNESILYYSTATKIYLHFTSSHMFQETDLKTIDMSGFDTSYLYDIDQMFYNCTSLTTIYVSNTWDISNLSYSNSSLMFDYDENLIGGNGTTYDNYHTNKDYAHIDGGPSNPGYLTDIADKE